VPYTLKLILYSFVLFLVCALASSAALVLFSVQYPLIDLSQLERYEPGRPTILLDMEGNEWARFAIDRRDPATYAQIPQVLVHAFMAAEDHYFFDHAGISLRGILRSLLVNLRSGRVVQGASTITQQLVKLLFTDQKRTLWRKLTDQFLALVVESHFSKEHILLMYLNHVCFGRGIYGVEAACQRFWGISVSELTLAQAATLAAIVKSPGRYCPLNDKELCKKRRNIVLSVMHSMHMIDKESLEKALATDIELVNPAQQQIAPHAKEAVRKQLQKMLGKVNLYTGGYTVQTTLSLPIQQKAERAFQHQMGLLREKVAGVDGGLLSLDPETGAIRALIGGYDYESSKFDRALQARRQVGSIFKPLIYATAIEKGGHFGMTEIDEPLSVINGSQSWQPKNHTNLFEGEMTLARALAHSNNIIAVKTLLTVGIQSFIDKLRQCGLTRPIAPYPSLALGCIDCTLCEAVGIFNIFANNGVYVEPHLITWIKDAQGKKIWRAQVSKAPIFSSSVAGQVAKVLAYGFERARKRYGKEWIESEAIGKTGTTNDSRTCCFVGSTPELTTGITIGCDDNRSLGKNVYASATSFPIWRELYQALRPKKKHFSYDPHLIEITIDSFSGQLVSSRTYAQAIPIFRDINSCRFL
jgi:penicillin-binding protein 1A